MFLTLTEIYTLNKLLNFKRMVVLKFTSTVICSSVYNADSARTGPEFCSIIRIKKIKIKIRKFKSKDVIQLVAIQFNPQHYFLIQVRTNGDGGGRRHTQIIQRKGPERSSRSSPTTKKF